MKCYVCEKETDDGRTVPFLCLFICDECESKQEKSRRPMPFVDCRSDGIRRMEQEIASRKPERGLRW